VDQSHFEPVKIVIERRVRPGAKSQFEQWTRSFMTTASRFPGLEGSSVFDFNATGDYFILLRFASQAHLENWRNAPEVRALCKLVDSFSTATDRQQVKTGLETWFAVPSRSVATAVPPRWKMALVTWLALFPQVVILSLLIPSALPIVIRIALLTAAPVAMLTWLVMPLLSELLHEWLYAARTV
jgi:antibiotic biosynthesis monooxygenase (ABM) superfamily enzyme